MSIYEGLTPAESEEATKDYALDLLGVECNRVANNLELLTNADYEYLRAAVYAFERELLNEEPGDPC